MPLRQFLLTPAMGKRLIARGMLEHHHIKKVLQKGVLVIIAGSTNGYVAEEILTRTKQSQDFHRRGFRRGVVIPPNFYAGEDEFKFGGDVILHDGRWENHKTIFEVVDDMSQGDVILKGANAINLARRSAGVLIEHPRAGTSLAAVSAAAGRRVRLMIPVGVEKRVDRDIMSLAVEVNAPGATGPRLMPLAGEIFTELDAIKLLTGAEAFITASGGIHGAEGAVWLGVSGNDEQLKAVAEIIESLADEPPCQV